MSEQDPKKTTNTPEPKDSQNESPDARRRFIKAGLVGVPVILTLKSRPAWGNSGTTNDSALTTSNFQSPST